MLAEGFPEEAAVAARALMIFSASHSTPALGFYCSPDDSCQSGVARLVPGWGVAASEVWASEPDGDWPDLVVLLGRPRATPLLGVGTGSLVAARQAEAESAHPEAECHAKRAKAW